MGFSLRMFRHLYVGVRLHAQPVSDMPSERLQQRIPELQKNGYS